MAYRGDDAGDALKAPTAEGVLEVMLTPSRVDVSAGTRRLHLADGRATLVEHKRKKPDERIAIKIVGPLVIARGWPREAVGIWLELVQREVKPLPMMRIFGVEPASLLEGSGLGSLARLDLVVQRLRSHVETLGYHVRRGTELGSGHALDKVLLVDHRDHYVVYARRLFRDRARFTMTIHNDGRIVVPEGKTTREVRVTSRFGVTVRGDYIRFADRHGSDLAKVSVPWISPEDRDELAHRIGKFVDQP